MAKKESRRVKTLDSFIKWTAQFNDGQYLFRGVLNHKYEITASASLRLGENGSDPMKLLKINKEMIDDAHLQGHDMKNGQRLYDLELLAELQHYGAATCLIDFTYSAQVALWMACRQCSEGDVNGKVFAVRGDDPVRFKKVTPKLLQKDLDYFFKRNERSGYPLYQWQPKYQNNRIIAQQSVFLFGGAKIEPDAECVILKGSKKTLQTSLEKSSGIIKARLFPDFDGFARLRAYDTEYIEPNARNYLQRGIEAEQENRRADAIVYYNEVIALKPVDDLTLAEAHCYKAYAYDSEGKDDLAVKDYSKAIELKPDFAYAYRNRGLTYEKRGEVDLAIKDYSKAIDINSDSSLDYSHRARAYRAKGETDLAIEDHRRAIHLNPYYINNYYDLAIIFMRQRNWENAKEVLDAAQNRELDIISLFSQYHQTIAYLEEEIGIELPEDIAAMLYSVNPLF